MKTTLHSKNILIISKYLLISLQVLFLVSCISQQQITQMGLAEFDKLKEKQKISKNQSYVKQVERVSKRLLNAMGQTGTWEFVVFEDKTPNAFALPGGKVGIHTGIFQISKTDAGLATVLSHEIAHVLQGHSLSQVNKAQGIGIAGVLVNVALITAGAEKETIINTSQAYNTLTAVGFMLPNSRAHEYEADIIGMQYMAKAGYNPAEAVKLWERFAAYNKKQGQSTTPEFLRTHPLDDSRIKALRQELPKANAIYQRSKS